MSSRFELTVAIIKPHAIKVPRILKGIQDIIISNGFYVIRSKTQLMTNGMAEMFYEEHRNRFFYGRLITLMTRFEENGPSQMLILGRENAILKWREIMGPTKVARAQITHPDTIRGRYGLTDTRNATHGSDSPESTQREMRILFPEFDLQAWHRNEEQHFLKNNVYLDKFNFVHRIRTGVES